MGQLKGRKRMTSYNQLIEIVSQENVGKDKPLKNHTYTELGGTAEMFVTPVNDQQAQDVVKLANKIEIPFMLLENGSNLIIKDGGIRGIVMYLGELNAIRTEGSSIFAQSCALIRQVSKSAL